MDYTKGPNWQYWNSKYPLRSGQRVSDDELISGFKDVGVTNDVNEETIERYRHSANDRDIAKALVPGPFFNHIDLNVRVFDGVVHPLHDEKGYNAEGRAIWRAASDTMTAILLNRTTRKLRKMGGATLLDDILVGGVELGTTRVYKLSAIGDRTVASAADDE